LTVRRGLTGFSVAAGWLAALMGITLILPVVVARIERGMLSRIGIAVLSVGFSLVACGMTAVLAGVRQRQGSGTPTGVRAAVAANILFLAFFALEFSDGLVRQDGRIAYWSTFLFLPALVLFCGLLTARRWAWWTFRGASALGTIWFLGFMVVIPFANLQGGGVSVPWQGRVYMVCVSLMFAGILAGAFWSLGRPETRNYFRLTRIERSAPPGSRYGTN
jgi:hypothetical protein